MLELAPHYLAKGSNSHLNNIDIKKIAFIGAGNMAQAIIRGLINNGIHTNRLCASAPSTSTREKINREFGIAAYADNSAACADADIVILSVKPQRMREVCAGIVSRLGHKPLIVSVAAGIRIESISSWLGDLPIVRCMPNTPSAVGAGACGFFCNELTNAEHIRHVNAIFSCVGIAVEIPEEKLIDTVTAISGSGPAYFFLFIEAMIAAGERLGLNNKTATQLATQTANGAAQLALNSDVDIATLRKKVTSPNGTTERALLSFQSDDLHSIVNNAMQACAQRAHELSEEQEKKP